METRSINDLIEDVLINKLRIIDVNEEPEQHDANTVSNKYTEKYAELVDEGVDYWDSDSIPVVIFDAVSGYVGNAVGPSYGIQFDAGAELFYINKIRKHVAKTPTRRVIPAEYF